jgi:hypothetical protein
MTRHISERTLARFGQGDLSAHRSARIRAHLDECARCSEVSDDLAGITTLLADVRPPPIPEHLTARIHTALAAEAAKRATLTPAASGAGAQPAGAAEPDAPAARPGVRSARHERPLHGRRQPRAFRLSSPIALRTMAATAAAVVLAGGGYEIAMHAGGSGRPSTAASGPQLGPAATRPNVSGPLSAAAPLLHYEYAGHQDSIVPVASPTNYAPATLSGQVSRELRQNPPGSPRPAGGSALHSANAQGAAGSAATFGSIPLSRLQGCVTGLAAGQQVLLVDVAQYQGRPATVIVTRASAGGPEQVWVVGTACSDAQSDVFTHVTLAATG